MIPQDHLPKIIELIQSKQWVEAKAQALQAIETGPWSVELWRIWQYLQEQPELAPSFRYLSGIDAFYQKYVLWIPLPLFMLIVLSTFLIWLNQFWRYQRHKLIKQRSLDPDLKLPSIWPQRVLLLVSLSLSAVLLLKWYFQSTRRGFTYRSTPVYSAADEQSLQLGLLPIGTLVWLKETHADWQLIRSSIGVSGWINRNSLLLPEQIK